MTAIPMKLPMNLPDATRSEKSRWRPINFKYVYAQFVNKIATKLQWLYLCFWVQLSNKNSGYVVQPQEETESRKSKMAALNFKYDISFCKQDSIKIPTAVPWILGSSNLLGRMIKTQKPEV